MAYISFQPSDYFSTKLYTGTGSELAVTGVGFQPDFTWLKVRNVTGHHQVWDAARGVTKVIYPSQNDPEGTVAQSLKTFDSDGFTLGTGSYVNTNTNTYASYNWKAGTTSGIATNGSTTITPSSYSFDQTRGISIIKYAGNNTSGAKVAHGLGVVPQCALFKVTSAADDWSVYHQVMGNTKYLELNNTQAETTSTDRWNDTDPDSVNFTLGNAGGVNASQDYIAYCFAGIKGYSKFGSFTGNANADGPFVYTGFRPAFVMIKNTSAVEAWNVWNDKTSTSGKNVADKNLQPNATTAEQTSITGVKEIDLVSNGFKVRGSNTELNGSGNTLIYAAFAEFPIVSSNDTPGLAR